VRRRLFLSICVCTFAFARGVSESEPRPCWDTPDRLLAEIGTRSSSTVVLELYDSNGWARTIARIESGERDWLLVALALAPGTDGAISEELFYSIDRALISNASGVLELFMSDSRYASSVCHGYGEFAHSSYESASRELRAKISGVDHVSNPALASQKRACLEKLHASGRLLESIYGRH
jgi:hypothetical protein